MTVPHKLHTFDPFLEGGAQDQKKHLLYLFEVLPYLSYASQSFLFFLLLLDEHLSSLAIWITLPVFFFIVAEAQKWNQLKDHLVRALSIVRNNFL